MSPLLSICIPSYNRPQQLMDLLLSIDCNPSEIEVVICEDFSPKRLDIRALVETFCHNSKYVIHYHENEVNRGYDGNIRRLVELARGKYVMFMGDDDLFVPGMIDKFINFLKEHADKKYVLRSYITIHPDGHTETFRYLPGTAILPAGESTVAWLFKRSVSLCGFTIRREDAQSCATSDLDGDSVISNLLDGKSVPG